MAKLMYDAGAISQTEYDDILMKHAALTEALAQEVRLVSHPSCTHLLLSHRFCSPRCPFLRIRPIVVFLSRVTRLPTF